LKGLDNERNNGDTNKYLQLTILLYYEDNNMALVSPGVELSIIDESQYRSAVTNSVPFILIATAENKVNAAGTGVAAGTTAANANNTYLITSQRELVNTFGNPFFYNTTAGTPINGYELNEYGLLAAYSVLGVSNRAYVQRVDVDLAELAATLTRPTSNPANNTWWLDTAESTWGIFEWSSATNAFTNKVPTVITSTDDLDTGIPKASIGTIGSYAIVATNVNNPLYYKNRSNAWVLVGSDDWKASIPTVAGTTSSPTLTGGETVTVNGTTVTLSGTTVASFAADITSAGVTGVTAAAVNNKLEIYVETGAGDADSSLDVSVTLADTSGTPFADCGITVGTYAGPVLQQSAHTTIPRWRSTDTTPRPTGSVWQKTTAVNSGMNLVVKKYSTTTGTWVSQSCPVYANDETANYELDRSGGGTNLAQGSTYAVYDVSNNNTATIKVYERVISGATAVTGNDTTPTFTSGNTFTISASAAGSSSMTTPVTATLAGTAAADFVAAVLAADVDNVSAAVLSTGAVQITHSQGGVIDLVDTAGTPVADAGFVVAVEGINTRIVEGTSEGVSVTNWTPMLDPDGTSYSAQNTAPGIDPTTGTLWYYSSVSEVDIMIHDGTAWKGYNNVSNDVRGFDLTNCDPNGVQVAASAPTTQSDSSALVYGDLWIDSSDLENFPLIKRWESVDSIDQWVTIDNSDQTTENGVLFADARWGTAGTIDPISDDFPEISDLVTSNYLDIDAPDPALYPAGTLLFNTRRSGYNVKRFEANYFNAADFPDDTLPTEKNCWVTASGNKNDGSMYAGRQAQRRMVTAAMQAGVDANTTIREEQRVFNLLAAPGYPELMDNLVALNNDRNNTGFVVGDTPLRLSDSGTELVDWATNNNGTGLATEDGLNVNDVYLGVFYPSGQTNDLSGNTVVVPPSHMMLRTIIRNDNIGYEWLAPAGTRRGNIDNVSALGYVDAQTGEFVQIANRQGVRDTLYENNVNPITFIPGTGLVNYGNKTTQSGSALDRINVARLTAWIRKQVESIGKGYLFEPNDKITRDEIKNQIEGLMNDLTAKRGIYDYLVVCDETNNTPSRIDRSELYVDIAIEPTKAVEYVYIPLRIKNTGEIDAGL
jgi:hypothetical protein